MARSDRRISIEPEEARAGSREGVVRWVLGISLALAAAAMTVIWISGALSQSAVESEGTAEGRAEVLREQTGRTSAN